MNADQFTGTVLPPCPAVSTLPSTMARSVATVLRVDVAHLVLHCAREVPHRGHAASIPGTSGVYAWE